MIRWARSPRRVALHLLGIFLIWIAILWIILPSDSAIILWLRFTSHQAASFISGGPYNDEDWFFRPARFPVDLNRDAAFILKTGYGTQARVPAQLRALGLKLIGRDEETVLVVADFSRHYKQDGQDFLIHDMVAAAMENEALSGMQDTERLNKYREMSRAIQEDKDGASSEAIGKKFGWELDAMKFMPALELAWKKLPRKKWYLMLDDDTYIIHPSLQLILGHLDPSRPQYLGNAVGDYKGRFAHGGSAIAISEAAMALLFGFGGGSDTGGDSGQGGQQRPPQDAVVRAAYVDSLTETWGDRLVAHTFMKVGVYLDERYAHFFNGEDPASTRVRADRFCAPLVSFHALADPARMTAVGEVFRDIASPVFWSQLWMVYGMSDVDDFREKPVKPGEDHVGRTDESTTTKKGVESAERCMGHCDETGWCLAWTWEVGSGECRLAPWVVMGEKVAPNSEGSNDPEGQPKTYSGLSIDRVQALHDKCNSRGGKHP